MEFKDLLNYVLGAIILAFNVGIYFKKLLTLPDADKVRTMIKESLTHYISKEEANKMQEKHILNCSSKAEINTIVKDMEAIKDEQEKHKENYIYTIENLKHQIAEIRINLKSLCTYLGHKYIDGNNNYLNK